MAFRQWEHCLNHAGITVRPMAITALGNHAWYFIYLIFLVTAYPFASMFLVFADWTTTPEAVSSESWGTIVRRLRSTHFGILVSIHFSVPLRLSDVRCPPSDFCGFVWSRRAPHLRSVASQLTVQLTEPPAGRRRPTG